jgi:hypothetical protein
MNQTIHQKNLLEDEPNWLSLNFENIPIQLQSLPWAVWKAEPRLDAKGNKTGKWNKAPLSPLNGYKIGTNQPEKFGTFADAKKAFSTGKYNGVGVLLNQNGIVGFDIDNAMSLLAQEGPIKDWLKQAKRINAYCELSPSNKGLRLFVLGRLDSKGRKHGQLEVYDKGRFLTITGNNFFKNDFSNKTLIEGQSIINSFLEFFPKESGEKPTQNIVSIHQGQIRYDEISNSIKEKLPDIFNRSDLINDKYERLFNGDTTMHENDHSAADLALCAYFAKQGLTPLEADQVFRASKLYRPKWDEKRGEKNYGDRTLDKAYTSLERVIPYTEINDKKINDKFKFSNTENYKPIYYPGGMPSRKFIGPKICEGSRLFPANALSSLVALGAVGKTTLLLSIACHVACGKSWNGYSLEQKKVAMFFCEESQEEISRKYSAIVDEWSQEEKKAVESNLLTIPLLGVDARLTAIERNQYKGSGVAEEIISLLTKFELRGGLVILDHMQGFSAGDLNFSETATSICREVNKIVDSTGAALVLAAHISKANINAKEVEQGFAVGSLAFENATRQMSGLITMPQEIAKKYGLEATRKEYVRLSLAKNSYESSDNGLWLHKTFSPKYHTVILEPVLLTKPIPPEKLDKNKKIGLMICNYISSHPHTTRNKLDKVSGLKGPLKTSKAVVRQVIEDLIASGQIKVHSVNEAERNKFEIPKQVKEILIVNDSSPPSSPPSES